MNLDIGRLKRNFSLPFIFSISNPVIKWKQCQKCILVLTEINMFLKSHVLARIYQGRRIFPGCIVMNNFAALAVLPWFHFLAGLQWLSC
jgi:hypothetical protein